jgi:DNA-binding GntR family transcriptional regulator
MSRTPVREALLLLEHEKLVECDGRLGYIVRRLNAKEVEEYFSIRKIFEVFAVPLILERITEDEVAALQRNLSKAENFLKKDDFHNFIRCETEFHEMLWRSAKSEIFFQIISGLSDKFQWLRAIALSAPGSCRVSIDDHQKILVLIKERNAKSLKRFMQQHIEHARKKYSLTQGIFL